MNCPENPGVQADVLILGCGTVVAKCRAQPFGVRGGRTPGGRLSLTPVALAVQCHILPGAVCLLRTAVSGPYALPGQPVRRTPSVQPGRGLDANQGACHPTCLSRRVVANNAGRGRLGRRHVDDSFFRLQRAGGASFVNLGTRSDPRSSRPSARSARTAS